MRHRQHKALTAAILLATAQLFAACGGEDDPLACRDGSCAHQGTKTFCDIDGVYPSAEAPNECIEPPADDACNRAVACTNPDTPYCNDDSMGTCVECTDNTHCTEEGESCDTRTGECTDEPVFTCEPGTAGDAECAARNNGLDYCADAEICVACITNDHCIGNAAGEVCDQTLLECRTCQGPQDCESGICGAVTEGLCVPVDDIVYVDAAAPDNTGCGVEAQPCNTIQKGLDITTAQRNVVRVAAGTYAGDGNALIEINGISVAIVGDGSATFSGNLLNAGDSTFDVRQGSALTLMGIEIAPGAANAGAIGITCQGNDGDASITLIDATVSAAGTGAETNNCELTLRGATVTGNSGIGISATGGTVDIQRSTIASNSGGGIEVDGADFTIVNNFITENVSTGAIGGMRVQGTSGLTEVLEFNTFAENVNGGTFGYALACQVTTLVAKNNIFMHKDGTSLGLIDRCNVEHSIVDAESTNNTDGAGSPITETNGVVFDNAAFVNASVGDFHLAAGSAGIDVADGAAPDTDIDGDPRDDGSPDMGADEVQ